MDRAIIIRGSGISSKTDLLRALRVMIAKEKRQNCQIAVPCPYMIFDKGHYHTCELLLSGDTHCLCVWWYDIGGVNSDSSKPTQTTKADVSKLCPRGFTYEQIDAKIKAFYPWMTRP